MDARTISERLIKLAYDYHIHRGNRVVTVSGGKFFSKCIMPAVAAGTDSPGVKIKIMSFDDVINDAMATTNMVLTFYEKIYENEPHAISAITKFIGEYVDPSMDRMKFGIFLLKIFFCTM